MYREKNRVEESRQSREEKSGVIRTNMGRISLGNNFLSIDPKRNRRAEQGRQDTSHKNPYEQKQLKT